MQRGFFTSRHWVRSISTVSIALAICPAHGQEAPSLKVHTEGLHTERGLLPAIFDSATGRLLLEVPHEGEPVLHGIALSSGLSWPLDRGSMPWDRPAQALRFRHDGEQVQILRGDRAPSGDHDSSHAVTNLPLVARTGDRLLVDATDLVARDAFGVAGELEWLGESGTLDAGQTSIIWPPAAGTDRSTSIDVRLTFDAPGGSQWLERRSPDPDKLTVVQRHIFFRGSPAFQPRPGDSRIGIATSPTGQVLRWHLAQIPSLTIYLEPTIPAEYREAVRKGIAYWKQTFAAIGFPDAIRGADLPAGTDPLDLRYPIVLTWLDHWHPLASMTHHLSDPETGELVKAVVQIESRYPLVARNEYRAYRAALAEGVPSEEDYINARLAFVVAHELAHAFGLHHAGFRETAVGFHLARLELQGERVAMDLGRIVPKQPRAYDLWVTRYAYEPLPPGGEAMRLAEIAAAGPRSGLRYLNPKARDLMPEAVGRIANPDHLEGLREALAVRALLLDRFGEEALDPSEPKERLYERLVPAYFHHRFALDATCRMVGGLRHVRAKDDPVPVPGDEQWRALHAVLEALTTRYVRMPEEIQALMPPGPGASADLRLRGEVEEPNVFRYQTGTYPPTDIAVDPGAAFDPSAWTESLASMVFSILLDRRRAARLEAQALEDSSLPTLTAVLDTLLTRTLLAHSESAKLEQHYERAVHRSLLARLIELASDEQADPAVRKVVRGRLARLRAQLYPEAASNPAERAFLLEAVEDLDEILQASPASSPSETTAVAPKA